ncbi:hypothetical protein OQI_32540 [Streptomyces pharetrae CZA14]|uniref:Uncharacterized protein n=1 Tax=Streptomyces pharetrae CZA14 TaxID=1144883 RepID=A0ABX3YB70_9ACTN|nr:hypothetical protein OQI_32540 [Streptomyces pharetrae CZA14]
MEPINAQHVAELGLLVVEVAAADGDTALAFQAAVAARWATATTDRTTHEPGQPGVRLRFYLDLRQELGPQDQTPDHPAAGSAEAPDG